MAIGVTVLASGSNGNCIAVHADGNTVLHFQLRKETVKLNPELWIGR